MKKWIPYTLLLISISGVLFFRFYNNQILSEQEKKFIITKNVASQVIIAQESLSKLQKELQYQKFHFKPQDYIDNDVFIYKRSKLAYWSQNSYAIDSRELILENKSIFVQSNQYGDFLIVKGNSLHFTIAISIPLSRKYKTNNRFIRDEFNTTIFNNFNLKIINDNLSIKNSITYNDIVVFGVVFNKSNLFKSDNDNAVFYLISISVLFITIYFISIYQYKIVYIVAILSFLRLLLFVFRPDDLGGMLYDPSVFASSFLHPNLNEFLVNLLFISLIFYIIINSKKVLVKYSLYINMGIIFMSFLFLYDVIVNSLFNISPYDLINLDSVSWMLLFPILYICLVLSISVPYFSNQIIKKKIDFAYIVVQSVLVIILWLINQKLVIWYCVFSSLTIIYYKYHIRINVQLTYLIFLVLVSLIITDYKFDKDNNGKQLKRLDIGSNILEGSDPYLEYLINDVSNRISKDKIIISKLKSPLTSADNLVKKKIEKVYLQNYFEGYEFDIQVVSIDQVIRLENGIKVNNVYYKAEKKEFNDLYQIKKEGISFYRNYIKLVWFDDANLVKNICIQFKEKETNKYSVMPQLLLDEGRSYEFFDNISFALVNDGVIRYQFGNYKYSLKNINRIFNGDLGGQNYNHNIINNNDEKLIISTAKTSIREFLDYFSFISILLIVFFFMWYVSNAVLSRRKIQFTERVQVAMSFFVLLNIVSLLFIVVTSFNSTYKEQISFRYSEVAKNVSSSLKNILSMDYLDKREIADKLAFMSKNQDVDIHLFNNEGQLLISTLPEIFEKNMVSKKIKYSYYNIRKTIVSDESIAGFKYSSAYSPILKDGKILGVVNIPFFSSDEELMDSINGIVYSILDISLVTIAFFLIVSNFLSNKITKPLKLLKENLESVTLLENKQIEWKSDDEIGGLVKSYNTMLIKLSESKEKLKAQEKKNAWKEMAKQVAHEIKNPLTPMKLSLQFLQKKMQNSSDENKELSKSTGAIIDQIDNLVDIVSSFSEFATMPEYEMIVVNLRDLIDEVVQFHSQSAKIILTNFKVDLNVKADKKALTGILTNIIINGIQSVKEFNPKIIIECVVKNGDALISIIDNGEGIEDEIKDKIFVPNFSTKYSGSGIGLALAKQGIEHFGGRIWFDTKLHHGTTFYIKLPLSL